MYNKHTIGMYVNLFFKKIKNAAKLFMFYRASIFLKSYYIWHITVHQRTQPVNGNSTAWLPLPQ